MTASSVTGTGNGMQDEFPGNNRGRFVSLGAPHVIAAGTVQLDGSGNAVITFPQPLPLNDLNYSVLVTGSGSSPAAVWSGVSDSYNQFIAFNIHGTDSDRVHWAVISHGFSGINI